MPRTFSAGVSETTLTQTETVLLNHTLAAPFALGALTYLWATGSASVATTVFRLYVDGGAPLTFPLAAAAGVGFPPASDVAPWQSAAFGSLGRDSWFSTLRVPFASSLVVTYAQAPGAPDALFFAQARGVDGGEPLRDVLDGFALPAAARLQVLVRGPTSYAPLDYMELAAVPAGVSGALFGTSLWWDSASSNTIEGCVRSFSPPEAPFNASSLLSTGWEDYYASSCGMIAGAWTGPFSGTTTWSSPGNLRVSAYRLHTRDPLFFDDGIRLVLRNGETTDASGQKCRLETGGNPVGTPGATNLSVIAWVYVW